MYYKVWWIVQRIYQQKALDYQKTFAIVVKHVSYKAFFAITSALDLKINHLDIQTSLLYRNINKKIFVKQLTGQENGIYRVY